MRSPKERLTRRGRLRTLFSALFLVAGVAGIALSFARSWEGSVLELRPAWTSALLATALSMAGLCGLAASWVAAVGIDRHRLVLVRAFFLSQLGKYVPGGVWQAAGQVAFSLRAGRSPSFVWGRLVGFTIILAVAPTPAIAAGVPWLNPEVGTVRVLLAVTPVALLVLHPAVSGRLTRLATRLTADRLSAEALWAASWRQRAVPLATLGAVVYGAGYAVLLQSLDPGAGVVAGTTAFVTAWLAGLLAVPVPAGVGVREAVLILLLQPDVPVAAILAASVAYRLVGMVGEVVLAATSSVVVRLRERASAVAPLVDADLG